MSNIVTNILSILAKNEKRKWYVLTLCNMAVSLLDILSLAAMLFIINFYTQQSPRLSISFLPGWLINRQSTNLVLFFLLFFLLKNAAAYATHTLQYRFVYNVASRISRDNMLNCLRSNFANHVHTDSAVFIRRISNQPIEFSHYVLSGIQQIITELTLIVLATATIMWYNATLFLMVAALLLPVALLLWFYMRKKINTTRSNIKNRSQYSLQYLKEGLAGYVESNIYNKHNFFTQRYARAQQTLNTSLAGLQVIQGMPNRLLEVFAVIGLFILIMVGNAQGALAAQSFITLGAFMAAAYKIIPGLVKIINISGQVKTYRYTVQDLLAEKSNAVPTTPAINCPPLQSITFNKVVFNYNNHAVLNGFDMRIVAGDFIGIAAPSGKGKTTVINILLGLLQQDAGEVYMNDAQQSMQQRQQFWPRIAYVKQQNFLIHDTIEKNIVLDEGSYPAEKLSGVINATGLDVLISQYPEGIQKIITENGKNISGGQRQRIAIARALFKEADLLILDEPFNELDEASALRLLLHCKTLSQQGKIIILITHGQNSLQFCNKIIELNGR